jgi:hypothetical protein
MKKNSIRSYIFFTINKMPAVFGNHHLPFLIASVSVAFLGVEKIFGHEYATFILELSTLFLFFVGIIALSIKRTKQHFPPLPPKLSSHPPPVIIPTPVSQRNQGIRLVHEHFAPKNPIACFQRLLGGSTLLIREDIMQFLPRN